MQFITPLVEGVVGDYIVLKVYGANQNFVLLNLVIRFHVDHVYA